MTRIPKLWFAGLLFALLLAGCATVGDQVVPTTVSKNIALKPGDLTQHGLAFLTPSTVTGQEQDRQSLALIFAEAMSARLPAVHLIPLSDTLGLINRAGLSGEYRKMLEGYRETGIFTRDSLGKIGQAVGTRYFAQLKLAGFNQDTFERFSLLGFRLFQTLHANIRLYLQIWDSETGVIAWEGSEELSYSYDTSAERPVTFQVVVEAAARHLIERLP